MENKNLLFKSYQTFFKLIAREKKNFAFLLLILLIEMIVLSSTVVLTIPLADYLLDPNLTNPNVVTKKFQLIINTLGLPENLYVFLGAFVIFNFAKAITTVLIYYYVLKIKYEITYNFTDYLLKNIFSSNWRIFNNLNQGSYLNSFTKVITNISNGFQEIALQISFITKIFIYLSIPLLIDWKITTLTIFVSIIIAIPFKFLNRTGNYLGKENLKYDNKLIQNLSESFTASKIIFGYSLQKNILDKILINLRKSIYFAKKSALISTLLVYFFQPIGILGASIAFIMFYNDKSQLSALAAIFWSLVSGIPIISNLLRGNFQILNLEPNIEQYNNLINETKKIEKSNSGQLINTFNKKINFKNVSFEYIINNSILENINLEINKKDFILIKGSSGIGKSTIVDLLMGFLQPNKGSINFDDLDYKKLNLTSVRNFFGYVSQDPYLFNSTIEENLTFAKDNLSYNDLKDAIKISNCEFIYNTEKGLKTNVGEKGDKLSGGEKQRISLCRSILFKPEILILDEPTSSLDQKSSDLIYSSLKNLKGKMTIVLISHEEVNNDIFNKIYKLENKNLIQIN